MKKLLPTLATFASIALLSGCAAPGDEAEPISIFDTEVGDCFTTDEDHTAAFIVPCTEPHMYEVSALHPIDVEEYPGDDTVQTLADETCPEAFLAYTGEVDTASTEWASMAFAPSEPGWEEQEQRQIVCVVTTLYGEPEPGSAKE